MNTGHTVNLAAQEHAYDLHRSAEHARLAAAARTPRARGRRETAVRTRMSWFSFRRSPKLA
jgi:hypothetical protein